MKTRLAIFIAFASIGASCAVNAELLPGDVPAPVVDLPGADPELYPSEQGAFKAIEMATQLIEAGIVQRGCQSARYAFEVHTINDGSGSAVLSNPWGKVPFTIALGEDNDNNGRWYTITGGGKMGRLNFTDINGQGSFNIGSSLQEFSTNWKTTSLVTFLPNDFKSTVIIDYSRLQALQPVPKGFDDAGTPVSTVIGYGYQQISKEQFIKAKYWQQSRAWRDDGVNAGVYWLNTRLVPDNQPCVIEVKLAGYGEDPADSIEGFNEKGSLVVKTLWIGPFSSER